MSLNLLFEVTAVCIIFYNKHLKNMSFKFQKMKFQKSN